MHDGVFQSKDQLKQDEIDAKQGWLLQQHLPRGAKLRITGLKQLFLQMRDHA